MKLELTMAIKESYSNMWSETVAIEVDGDVNHETVANGLIAIKKMVEERQFLACSTKRAVDIYVGFMEYKAKVKGVTEGKGTAKASYEIQSDLTKAQIEIGEKDCQIKGLIKAFDNMIIEKGKEAEDNPPIEEPPFD